MPKCPLYPLPSSDQAQIWGRLAQELAEGHSTAHVLYKVKELGNAFRQMFPVIPYLPGFGPINIHIS